MNNKGFAVTGIIYSLMVLFIILVIALLSMFSDRKTTLDKFKNDIVNQINGDLEVKPSTFSPTSTEKEFLYKIMLDNYYQIEMVTSNGITLTTEFYFHKNELVKIKFENNGKVEFYVDNNLLGSVDNNSNYGLASNYLNRVFINDKFDSTNQHEITNSSFTIKSKNKVRKNHSLDNVKYVKECIYSDNSISDDYGWSEFMLIHNGQNISDKLELETSKSDIDQSLVNRLFDYDYNNIVRSTKGKEKNSCISFKINTKGIMNLDYIKIWHNSDDRIYFDRKVYVSSDGTNYVEVDNIEKKESSKGNTVSAFKDSSVLKIKNSYFPIKSFDGARWMRIFHHNSKEGTVYWSSRSQLLEGIYNTPYKKSALSEISEFMTNGKYEFLLEYPDIDSTKYNRWTQSNNIINKDDLVVKSYSKIHTDFESGTVPFTGLRYSEGNYSAINGDDNNNYSIGYLKEDPVPGYGNYINGRIDLWIRIDEYLSTS